MPVLLYIRFPCVNLFLCHLIYSVGLFVSELTPQNSTINLFLKLLLPWLIPVNVLQNPLQCCKVISLQLIKINEKKIKLLLIYFVSGCSGSFPPSDFSNPGIKPRAPTLRADTLPSEPPAKSCLCCCR